MFIVTSHDILENSLIRCGGNHKLQKSPLGIPNTGSSCGIRLSELVWLGSVSTVGLEKVLGFSHDSLGDPIDRAHERLAVILTLEVLGQLLLASIDLVLQLGAESDMGMLSVQVVVTKSRGRWALIELDKCKFNFMRPASELKEISPNRRMTAPCRL